MKNYILIDKTGRPYMTGLDRKVLNLMLSAEAVRASSARKRYALAGSCKFWEIRAALEERAADCRLLDFERQDARRMIETMDSADREGRSLYALTITEGGRPAGTQYFMR